MTVLFVVAGILAALILFRWARTLALVALLLTGLYFWSHFEAWRAAQPVAAEARQ